MFVKREKRGSDSAPGNILAKAITSIPIAKNDNMLKSTSIPIKASIDIL